MLKKIVFIFVLFMTAPAAAAEYFSVMDDVPLHESMQEVENSIVYLDSPHGRIVKVQAVYDGALGAVDAFYKKTLPMLGWQVSNSPRIYVRHAASGGLSEQLVLEYLDDRRVQFTLIPYQED